MKTEEERKKQHEENNRKQLELLKAEIAAKQKAKK